MSDSAGQSGALISNNAGTALGKPTFELSGGALRLGHFGAGSDYNSIITPTLNI
jgi:hypothetical protein